MESFDFAREEEKASKMTDASLAWSIKDAQDAAEALKGLPRECKYLDQIHVYLAETLRRARTN